MGVSIHRSGVRARVPRFHLSAVCLAVGALLTGCGGGGTTGPLQQASPALGDADALPTAGYISPHRVTLTSDHTGAPVADVRVGVVDTGFLTDHFELRGQFAEAREFAGSGTLADNVVRHGT